jgi:hypothetical protein
VLADSGAEEAIASTDNNLLGRRLRHDGKVLVMIVRSGVMS